MKSRMVLGEDELATGRWRAENLASARALFDTHGCLLLDNVFEPALIARMRDAFMAAVAGRDTAWLDQHCLRVGEGRYMVSVPIAAPFNDPVVYANPFLLPLLHAFLEDSCVINSFGGVVAYPGSAAQHLHADHPPLFEQDEDLCARMPPHAITMVIPLVDLDENVGTTGMLEGSHRVSPDNDDRVTTFMPSFPLPRAGGAYLMDYRLIHFGTPNYSPDPRPIMYVVYSRPWFIDAANFYKQQALAIAADQFDYVPFKFHALFARAEKKATPAATPE